MEYFAFCIAIGLLLAVCLIAIGICIGRGMNDDRSVSKGTHDGSNSVWSSDDSVDKLNRNMDMDTWPYDKGSEEEKEELERLSNNLRTMRVVTGLCWTEKETLIKSALFMERELNDKTEYDDDKQ